MTDPVLAALITAIALVVVALISGAFLRNRKPLNPPDPDKALIGQVSVGWFMKEFEEKMASAVAEGLRRDRERRP